MALSIPAPVSAVSTVSSPVAHSDLTPQQMREVDALMDPEHRIQKAFNRMVRAFSISLGNDEAEVRSICNSAILRAVQTYSGQEAAKDCKCGESACSVLVRAAVRIAKNNILNAIEAHQTQKRGGSTFHVNIDEEWRAVGTDSHTEAMVGGYEMSHVSILQEKSVDAFRLGSPLQRVINLQLQERIKGAVRRFTVPQAAIFRLAMEPTRTVRKRSKEQNVSMVRAAQGLVKGSDADAQIVEGTIREILSL